MTNSVYDNPDILGKSIIFVECGYAYKQLIEVCYDNITHLVAIDPWSLVT